MQRRAFIERAWHLACAGLVVRAAAATRAIAAPVRPLVAAWFAQVNTLCGDLRGGSVSLAAWQAQMEALFERVEFDDLLAHIDFARVSAGMQLPDLGVTTKDLRFPELAEAGGVRFIGRIFGMQRGRAIIPHGHRNMVSGHMILSGRMHVRHYARVLDGADWMRVRPTIDHEAGARSATTISAVRDNVHWLIASGGPAYTLDVIVAGLDPQHDTVLDYLDPERAVADADGDLRVPVIPLDEALRRYGRDARLA